MSKACSKDIWVDPHTFGSSRACEILADMMNKDHISIYEKHRVLHFINEAIYQFHWVSSIKEKSVKERTVTLVRNDFFNRISNMIYSDKFKSYLRNVISHHYRKHIDLKI